MQYILNHTNLRADKLLRTRLVTHCNRCTQFCCWKCQPEDTHIVNQSSCLFVLSFTSVSNYGHLGTVHTQNNHVQKLDLEWVKKSCPTKTNKKNPQINNSTPPPPTSECHLSRTNKWKHNKFRIKFRRQSPSVFMEQSSFKFCSQSLF